MPTKMQIKGPIISNDMKWIYDWLEMDSTCPKDIEHAITKANGDDLEVEINSGGGDVYVGSEIYTALKSYAGNVITKIVGRAASAAGVIAMSGKKMLITPTGQFMLHNAAMVAQGDYRDMDHASDFLKNWNKSISNAYILKTGMKQEDLLALMDKETWLNAKQAVEYGFADEVMFDEGNQLVASANDFMLPPEAINKLRNIALQNNLILDNAGQKAGFNNVLEDQLLEEETTQNLVDNQQRTEGSEETLEIKNIEELKAAYPEMVAQIEAAAKAEGVTEGTQAGTQAERSRIQNIDKISAAITPELVNKAKYEEPQTAEQLAFAAVQDNAAKGTKFLADIAADANESGTAYVDAQAQANATAKEKQAQEEEAAAQNIADMANKKRGLK